MKVKDLMKPFPVTADVEDTLRQAIERLAWAGGRHLPVMEGEHLVGIISARDLATAHASAPEAMVRLREIMVTPVQTCGPDDSLTEVTGRMAAARIGCLPVTDRGQLVGLLTITDVLFAQERQAMQPHDGRATAADVMTDHPATVRADDHLLDAAARMAQLRVRHLPVTDGGGKLIGMLSDRDIRNLVGDPNVAIGDEDAPIRIETLRVSDAMTRDPIAVDPGSSCEELARLLSEQTLSAVPVIDDQGRPVGIVSYVDVLRAYATHAA